MSIQKMVVAFLALACVACEDPVSKVCTAHVAFGISVSLRDSASNLTYRGPVTIRVIDGAYVETRTEISAFEFGDSVFIELAPERPGTYTVEVDAPNRAQWRKTGVVVASDGCHVVPVPLRAMFQPAAPVTLEMYVGPQQVDCVGVFPQKCLLVRESPAAQWTYFYNSIEGFAWGPGLEYRLRVERSVILNPPADASSFTYRLLEVISKTQVS